jgi:hypothetical protein
MAMHRWDEWGMNDEELAHYINNSIVPLFHDLEDLLGRHILVNVDSGPGCKGQDLLNKCQLSVVYIYPGLPNSTSVQQRRTSTTLHSRVLFGVT